MKYSLKVLVISVSWEMVFSSSIKVILEVLLVLSVRKGLTVFQKVLFFCQNGNVKVTVKLLFFSFRNKLTT